MLIPQPRQRRTALPMWMLAGFCVLCAAPAAARQATASASVSIEPATGFGVVFNQQRQLLTAIFVNGLGGPPQSVAVDALAGGQLLLQSSVSADGGNIVVLADQALSVMVTPFLVPEAEQSTDQAPGRVIVLAQFN